MKINNAHSRVNHLLSKPVSYIQKREEAGKQLIQDFITELKGQKRVNVLSQISSELVGGDYQPEHKSIMFLMLSIREASENDIKRIKYALNTYIAGIRKYTKDNQHPMAEMMEVWRDFLIESRTKAAFWHAKPMVISLSRLNELIEKLDYLKQLPLIKEHQYALETLIGAYLPAIKQYKQAHYS